MDRWKSPPADGPGGLRPNNPADELGVDATVPGTPGVAPPDVEPPDDRVPDAESDGRWGDAAPGRCDTRDIPERNASRSERVRAAGRPLATECSSSLTSVKFTPGDRRGRDGAPSEAARRRPPMLGRAEIPGTTPVEAAGVEAAGGAVGNTGATGVTVGADAARPIVGMDGSTVRAPPLARDGSPPTLAAGSSGRASIGSREPIGWPGGDNALGASEAAWNRSGGRMIWAVVPGEPCTSRTMMP